MVYDAAASIFPDTYHQFLSPQSDVVPIDDDLSVLVDEDPNPYCRHFFEMLNFANSPLFEGCTSQTKMSMIGRLTNSLCSSYFAIKMDKI